MLVFKRHQIRVVGVVEENPSHAVLPEGGKHLGGNRVAVAGQQALQQGAEARVGGDLFEVHRGAQLLAVVAPGEADFPRQLIFFEAEQVASREMAGDPLEPADAGGAGNQQWLLQFQSEKKRYDNTIVGNIFCLFQFTF